MAAAQPSVDELTAVSKMHEASLNTAIGYTKVDGFHQINLATAKVKLDILNGVWNRYHDSVVALYGKVGDEDALIRQRKMEDLREEWTMATVLYHQKIAELELPPLVPRITRSSVARINVIVWCRNANQTISTTAPCARTNRIDRIAAQH